MPSFVYIDVKLLISQSIYQGKLINRIINLQQFISHTWANKTEFEIANYSLLTPGFVAGEESR